MNENSPSRDYLFQNDGFIMPGNVFPAEALIPLRRQAENTGHYLESNIADPFEQYRLKYRNDQGVPYDLSRVPVIPLLPAFGPPGTSSAVHTPALMCTTVVASCHCLPVTEANSRHLRMFIERIWQFDSTAEVRA
jgi:hypothetical protein